MKFNLLTGLGLGLASFGCAFGGVAAFRLDENTLASIITMLVTSAIVFAALAVVVLPLAWVFVTYIRARRSDGERPPQPQYPPVVVIGQTPPPYQVERNGQEPLTLPAGPRDFTIIGADEDDE